MEIGFYLTIGIAIVVICIPMVKAEPFHKGIFSALVAIGILVSIAYLSSGLGDDLIYSQIVGLSKMLITLWIGILLIIFVGAVSIAAVFLSQAIKQKTSGDNIGVVTGEFSGKYRVRVNNNICTAVSVDTLAIGDQVEVVSTDNEILIVKKISSQSPETLKKPVKIQISEKQAETILAMPSAFPLFLKFIGATVGSFILMAFILAITLKVDILIHLLIYIGVILIIFDIQMLRSKIISAIGAVFILWDIGRNTLHSWPNPSNIELIIFLILLGAVIITAFIFAFKRSKKVQDDKKQAIIKKSSQPQWTWLSGFPLFMQFIGATAGSFLLITVILPISLGGFTLAHSLIYMGAILIIFDMQMLQSRIISAIGAVFILWDLGSMLFGWQTSVTIENIFLILFIAVIATAFIFARKKAKKQNNLKGNVTILETTK